MSTTSIARLLAACHEKPWPQEMTHPTRSPTMTREAGPKADASTEKLPGLARIMRILKEDSTLISKGKTFTIVKNVQPNSKIRDFLSDASSMETTKTHIAENLRKEYFCLRIRTSKDTLSSTSSNLSFLKSMNLRPKCSTVKTIKSMRFSHEQPHSSTASMIVLSYCSETEESQVEQNCNL